MHKHVDPIDSDATFHNDPYRTKFGQSGETPTPRESLLYPFLSPPQTPDELGRLGGYRVLKMLGKGGMGMVFEAQDLELDRSVALKVILPEFVQDSTDASQRLLREARAMAAVKHDNLVTVYRAGRDRDTVFVVMELLEGETLDAWLKRVGQPSVKDILRIAKETAAGLVAIHERGLIHRDIKPANLWLEAPSGRVKILDFGLARTSDHDSQITAAGMLVGTPAYLSPEQARGKTLDPRSDLFSLGCVLYRLCAGAVPFRSENTLDQLAALAADDPAPITATNPAIPEPLANLIMELLAKKPGDRPASAADVLPRLKGMQRPTGPKLKKPKLAPQSHVKPDDATERLSSIKLARRRRKTRWWWYRGAAVAAFALVVLTSFLTVGGGMWRSVGSTDTAANVPLLELPKTNAVGWPLPPEKKGGPDKKGGDKKGPIAEILAGVIVQGKRSPASIFMHPAPHFEPPSSVTFQLDRRFRTFQAIATFNDTAPPDAEAVRFSVYGDGKLLWQSQAISSQAQAQSCDVSVEGVSSLKLEVAVDGSPRGAHAVWVDPVVKR